MTRPPADTVLPEDIITSVIPGTLHAPVVECSMELGLEPGAQHLVKFN